MCKVSATSGIRPEKSKELLKFIKTVTPFMTPNDKDGLGYAALDQDGNLFGERWLDYKQAFKSRQEYTDKDAELVAKFQGALTTTVKYNRFGALNLDNMASIILHTRMATCGVSMENTHPFVQGNTALIHNGVIRNTRMLKNITSTCDSECILNEYLDQNVSLVPEAIDLVADRLEGYYAVAVLSETEEGRKILDLFRDDGNATLWACYVKQLDAVVFCTRAEIVKAACKELKWSVQSTLYLEPGTMLRLDAMTGQPISKHEFSPRVKYAIEYEGLNSRLESFVSGRKS